MLQLAEGAAKDKAAAEKAHALAQRNLDKDDDDPPPPRGVKQGSQSNAEAATAVDTSSKSERPNDTVRLSRPPLNSTGGKRLDVRSSKGVLGDAPGTPDTSRSQSRRLRNNLLVSKLTYARLKLIKRPLLAPKPTQRRTSVKNSHRPAPQPT